LSILSILLVLGAGLLSQGQAPAKSEDLPPGEVSSPSVAATYGKLPLTFEANQGQTDPRVKFLSRGGGHTLFLTPTEAVMTLQQACSGQGGMDTLLPPDETEEPRATAATVLRMQLVGANPQPEAVGVDELPGRSNYFIGNDPKKWLTGVLHFSKVLYKEIYRGVDLVYYGTNQRQLEYDFVVAPGTDPKAIRLRFEGPDRLEVNAQGDLLLHFSDGEVRFDKPYVYQETEGARQQITGGYVLHARNGVSFEVGAYDASQPLIIDPVLSYATYLGGSGEDHGADIVVDATGNAYVVGFTSSAVFPTTPGALQTTVGGRSDTFVTKFNADGSGLIYSTYLGGSDFDVAAGITIDSVGNAYVIGFTFSTDFPTASPFQATFAGGIDAFVTKLNTSGSALLYSTYLGGNNLDGASGITVDASGNAYVTGITSSGNFPTANPFQATLAGVRGDAFVTKFNPIGSALVYSTYLGGSGDDHGTDIVVDATGNAYVTGNTGSTDFPTANPFQAAFGGLPADAFVTKFNPIGSALVYSTYLGGSANDGGSGLAMDASGNAYVTGVTFSTDFPTASPFQTAFAGGREDAFVTGLNAAGSTLLYSTYLGGSGDDVGQDIAVDATGNAYVTGNTGSTDFPTANPFQAAFGGGLGDAFVTGLNAAGSTLLYSTYLGGTNWDFGTGVAADASGNAYVTGKTFSTDFPTMPGAFQLTFGGTSDAFVAKIGDAPLATSVEVDIKPGGDPNAINPASRGLIPVAILTTEDFDALTVSPSTVLFGLIGASIAHRSGHVEDVDGDGDLDLVLHFRTQETGIECGDTEASLSGELFDGQAIQASDSIVTVGCN
jgi:hypothetical protein